MRLWKKVPILAALLLSLSAGGAEAQIGPIIDWITKLSGPGVTRFGLEARLPLGNASRAPAVSVAGLFGVKAGDGDGPDDADGLNTISGQATLDVPVVMLSPSVALLAIGGVGGTSFWGDNFDTFQAVSFPLMAGIRFRTGGAGYFRVAGGWNLFRFPDDAFAPIAVGTPPGEWEAAFGVQTAFIIDF